MKKHFLILNDKKEDIEINDKFHVIYLNDILLEISFEKSLDLLRVIWKKYSIYKNFYYKEFNMWQCIETWYLEEMFLKHINNIKKIEFILKRYEGEFYVPKYSSISTYVKELKFRKKIKILNINNKIIAKRFLMDKNNIERLKIVKLIFNKMLNVKQSKLKETIDYLLISEVIHQKKEFNYINNKFEYTDTFFGDVSKRLDKCFIIENDSRKKLIHNKSKLKNVLKIEQFLKFKYLVEAKKQSKNSIKNLIKLQNIYMFGIDISSLINKDLNFLIKKRYFESIVLLKICFNAIKCTCPKCILEYDEYDKLGRIFNLACKKERIPILAIQHGELNPCYKRDSINNIKPNYTFVSGNQYKIALIKKYNYKANEVILSGLPRFDKLLNLNKSKKELTLEKLNLNKYKNYFILTFFTQPLDLKINLKMLEMIKNSINELRKQNEKVLLLIKVHPRDSFYRVYKKNIVNFEDAIVFDNSVDSYLVLHITDLEINAYSTITIEAALFKKPTILINLVGSEFVDYAENKIALQVNTQQALTNKVLKFKNDNLYLDKYLENVNSNINYYVQNKDLACNIISKKCKELINEKIQNAN